MNSPWQEKEEKKIVRAVKGRSQQAIVMARIECATSSENMCRSLCEWDEEERGRMDE